MATFLPSLAGLALLAGTFPGLEVLGYFLPSLRDYGRHAVRSHTTRNPQPATRNPQPTTHNPQPTTHNPQPTTRNPQNILGTTQLPLSSAKAHGSKSTLPASAETTVRWPAPSVV